MPDDPAEYLRGKATAMWPHVRDRDDWWLIMYWSRGTDSVESRHIPDGVERTVRTFTLRAGTIETPIEQLYACRSEAELAELLETEQAILNVTQ